MMRKTYILIHRFGRKGGGFSASGVKLHPSTNMTKNKNKKRRGFAGSSGTGYGGHHGRGVVRSPTFVNPRLFPTEAVSFVWGESNCGQPKIGTEIAPAVVCTDNFLETVVEPLGWYHDVVRVPELVAAASTSMARGEEANDDEPEACQDQGQGQQSGVSSSSFAASMYCRNSRAVAATSRIIKENCLSTIAMGHLPVLIGGDHCQAMGSVSAAAARWGQDLVVIWCDAFADINTPDTSPSGNMNGMPLAALLGLPGMRPVPGFEDDPFKCLRPGNIGYFGLRSIDAGENTTIRCLGDLNKRMCSMQDIRHRGFASVLNDLMTQLNPGLTRPVHLSFDVSVLNTSAAASSNGRPDLYVDADENSNTNNSSRAGNEGKDESRGSQLEEALQLVRFIRQTGCLVSMDLVEINPLVGTPSDVATTASSAQWVLAEALGQLDGGQ